MFSDLVLDEALNCLVWDASRLDICLSRPATFAEVAKVSIGYKTVPQLTGPEPCEGGRMVVLAAISDGIATKQGEGKFWCLTGQGRLLVCEPLDTKQGVKLVPGIAFTLPLIRIRMVAMH